MIRAPRQKKQSTLKTHLHFQVMIHPGISDQSRSLTVVVLQPGPPKVKAVRNRKRNLVGSFHHITVHLLNVIVDFVHVNEEVLVLVIKEIFEVGVRARGIVDMTNVQNPGSPRKTLI